MGKGRGADRTGFSKANIVNSSIVSWSGSVDPITVLHLVRNFARSLKLSTSSQMFYHMNFHRKTPI